MSNLDELTNILGVEFDQPALLRQALTHRSYINEDPDEQFDNERLEFLGDAVLDFLVGNYLFRRFPQMREGEMTPLRAAIVRTDSLASFARELEFGRFLRLGIGEDESGGRNKTATLCAAFEAVVGAMYLDQGLDTVQPFIERLIEPALEIVLEQSLHIDAKSEFQVWAQGAFNITPHYVVTAAEGPDHQKTFTMQVMVGDAVWGEGRGSSKQRAAQAAAAVALKRASGD